MTIIMPRLWALFMAFLMLIGSAVSAAPDGLVAVPPLSQRITDLTATLTPQEVGQLEARLRAFEEHKGSQIAVLILPTTQPETIEQYAIRVVDQWKLGRKKVDDGALLLVAKNDRTLRIEVGYGLEGALSDLISKRIISDVITPRFKEGDFNGGIHAGIESMIKVIEGEPLPPAPARAATSGTDRGRGSNWVVMVVAVAAVLGGILRLMFGRLGGALVTGGLLGLLVWFMAGLATAFMAALLGFFFTLIGGGMLGGGGWYSGRGGGGGFGGGGFGGGGGDFGGGGASGRW